MNNVVMKEINIDTHDINYRINLLLSEKGYCDIFDEEERIKLMLECLRIYLLDKLLACQSDLGLNNDSTLYEIMEAIENNQTEDRIDSLSPIIHYMLNLINICIGRSLIWGIDEKATPEDIYFLTRDGVLDEFMTGYEMDFSKGFELIYKILVGEIKYENKKKITLKSSEK